MRLLKRDLEKVFNECKMIAVLQNNAINAEDMLLLKHKLRKHDITIKFFPNKVAIVFRELQTVFVVLHYLLFLMNAFFVCLAFLR